MAGFLNLNGSVKNLGDEARHFRLPAANPFPKLDRGVIRNSTAARTEVLLGAGRGGLPEMTSDLAGVAGRYAVENVKRNRAEVRPWGKVGLINLVGKMLGGGQSAARP